MGLDIYFYTIKDKAKYNRYRAAAKKYDTISDAMHAKYKEPYEAACKKWNEWYEAETTKDIEARNNDKEYKIDFDLAPRAELTDFMTAVEANEYSFAKSEYETLQEELGIKYEGDIDELYMRKKNWMCKYVETRHPELLTRASEYGMILEDGQALLSRADIEELLRRMRVVVENFKDYVESTGKVEADEKGWRTQEAIDWIEAWKPTDEMVETATKWLPGMSRFFYGSTEYDYHYFDGIRWYIDKFQKWLDEHEFTDCLLYEESW